MITRRPHPDAPEPLPMSAAELARLGWDAPDVVLVSGDAYVDHPSFAAAIIGRTLQAAGFKVAILAQPDWKDAQAFRSLGRPRLFFGVTAGNMDSMLNHYTANRLPRSDDAYSPGGRAGRRPDRATNVYAQRCREAFPGVPVVAGGVEASLRRLAHYDYWSDTVRPSVLVSSKADLVVFGMGERQVVEIARRLDAGESVSALTDVRGTAYLLGKRATLPPFAASMLSSGTPSPDAPAADGPDGASVHLPSFEDVSCDVRAFSIATRLIHRETNPFNARRLVQAHGDRLVVQNPPALPLSEAEMDALYDRPYTRARHPSYGADEIPAERMIAQSVTIMRGCFGGCSFCSITTHQGRVIQSRSPASVLAEVDRVAADPRSKGVVSDLGGPTANMYTMRCTSPETEAKCHRLSCVFPSICRHLGTDHAPLVDLMRQARERPGVRRVHVASGVRMDLAARSPEYLRDLAAHHVSGHLKVAPEHVSERVLSAMKKPPQESFERFAEAFDEASKAVGKEQYLVPYFIAGHPGSELSDMIELALFLKGAGYRPRQVQDFIPAPMDLATSIWHTGLDPHTLQPTPVARRLKERKWQRALMQFFKPENWFEVRDALVAAKREDLIGHGAQCLIRPEPPKEALEARAKKRGAELERFVHEDEAMGRDTTRGARGRAPADPGRRPRRRGGRGGRDGQR
ncbi:MAG: YgiQ family radical SAM protein [Planctomycetes bacterium]|nr:YgiQ family radical SAM protein [Planctomycetota bacterium]